MFIMSEVPLYLELFSREGSHRDILDRRFFPEKRPVRQRDWYFSAEQPAPAPRLAHPEGCAALRFVLVTGCVSRSGEHFPDRFVLFTTSSEERDFFVDKLLVRINIIVMIRWTDRPPWEFEFCFPGSLIATRRAPTMTCPGLK